MLGLYMQRDQAKKKTLYQREVVYLAIFSQVAYLAIFSQVGYLGFTDVSAVETIWLFSAR
jgi:hypothetical protein